MGMEPNYYLHGVPMYLNKVRFVDLNVELTKLTFENPIQGWFEVDSIEHLDVTEFMKVALIPLPNRFTFILGRIIGGNDKH